MAYHKIKWTFTIQQSLFDKKDRMVKIRRINNVYGAPTLFVSHLRYLELKLTDNDLFD